MRSLSLICVLASAAWAELPTIESEHPPTLSIATADRATRIERVALAIHSAPETTWLSISLAGRADHATELALAVPEGTRIFGLAVSDDRGGVWGRPMLHDDARHRHRTGGGPSALLAWSPGSAGQDHYRIEVETPAMLDIALQLPPLARLQLAGDAGVASATVDGKQAFVAKRSMRRPVIALERVAGTTGPCERCASEDVSIVAAKARTVEFFAAAAHPPRLRTIDKAIIRRYMKRHRPQLKHCYMQVAQWSPSVRGGVLLSFRIEADGTVAWAAAQESDLPAAVTDCLVAAVRSWEFPPSDDNVVVNYPIEFRVTE